MQTDSQSGNERRQFFRIDDSVSLSYRMIAADSLERQVEHLEQGQDSHFTVVSSLAAITQQMAGAMHQIEAARPEIATYLTSLDKKIDLLGRAFLAQTTDLLNQPVRAVNMSATGIAFDALEPEVVGGVLEMKILLLPSFIGILALAEVVACERRQDSEGTTVYALRVRFVYMREGDRDVLIQHVIKQQGTQLRQQRERREQQES